MDTSRKILNLRLDKRISQRDMAEACGITPGALSKIETGSNKPSAPVLHTIAKMLDTSADYLLDPEAPYPPLGPSLLEHNREQDPKAKVRTEITREELWLLKDMRTLGKYWREAAFAIPGANVETIRLVRFLLQRNQFSGAKEAEKEARKAARKGTGKKSKGKPRKKRSKSKS